MLLKWVLFLSVFFRGFRGHTIHNHKIETVLGQAEAGRHAHNARRGSALHGG
jgi:hypothetical protein